MSLASDGLRSSGPVAGGMAQCTKESAHLAKQIGVFWLQWGCFLLIRESDNCSLLREAVCHSFVVSFFILGGCFDQKSLGGCTALHGCLRLRGPALSLHKRLGIYSVVTVTYRHVACLKDGKGNREARAELQQA